MPLDPDLRIRLDAWREAAGLEALLLTSPFSVDWASGHETSIETGPNPFAGGPTLLLVEAGRVALLYPDCEAPDLAALGLEGLAYPSYAPAGSLAPHRHWLETARRLLAGNNPRSLGVETAGLPAALAPLVADARPVDADQIGRASCRERV